MQWDEREPVVSSSYSQMYEFIFEVNNANLALLINTFRKKMFVMQQYKLQII